MRLLVENIETEQQKENEDCKINQRTSTPANHVGQSKNVGLSFWKKETQKMRNSADWWSLWIGLISFTLAISLVFTIPYNQASLRVKYVIPQPMRWVSNPFESWDIYSQ